MSIWTCCRCKELKNIISKHNTGGLIVVICHIKSTNNRTDTKRSHRPLPCLEILTLVDAQHLREVGGPVQFGVVPWVHWVRGWVKASPSGVPQFFHVRSTQLTVDDGAWLQVGISIESFARTVSGLLGHTLCVRGVHHKRETTQRPPGRRNIDQKHWLGGSLLKSTYTICRSAKLPTTGHPPPNTCPAPFEREMRARAR